MRSPGEKSIGEIMGTMMGDLKMKDPYYEAKILLEWENIAGKLIAKHTSKISVKNQCLFLTFDAAVYRQELHYQQQTIKNRVNEFLGEDYVVEIKIY